MTVTLGDGRGPLTPETMLESLDKRLDQLAPRRGARVTCVIGGGAVRYRIVPWSDELSSPAQRRTLAGHAFQDAYGEVARSWAIREHAVHHGRATLASAVDTSLIDAIEARCRARGLLLSSVQPSLMHAFNKHRKRVGEGLAWFVWIEARWVTALLGSSDEVLHVRQLATSKVDIAQLLNREWFALALDAMPCPAYVARAADAALPLAELSVRDAACRDDDTATVEAHSWHVVELPVIAVAAAPVPLAFVGTAVPG